MMKIHMLIPWVGAQRGEGFRGRGKAGGEEARDNVTNAAYPYW